jgi:hypothetical protein
MCAMLCFVLAVLAWQFKSKSRLEAENAALQHRLIAPRRKVHGRARLTNNDRWFFIQLYRWFPSIDGNVIERSIRPIALNRKNALFAGSDGGGERWAIPASLIETC